MDTQAFLAGYMGKEAGPLNSARKSALMRGYRHAKGVFNPRAPRLQNKARMIQDDSNRARVLRGMELNSGTRNYNDPEYLKLGKKTYNDKLRHQRIMALAQKEKANAEAVRDTAKKVATGAGALGVGAVGGR